MGVGISQHHNLNHESVSCISFLGCCFCWFSVDSSFNSCICCQNEKRRGSRTQIHTSPHTSPRNQSSLSSHTGSQSFCSHRGSHIGTGPGSSCMGSQIGSHSGPQNHRGLHSQIVSSTHHHRGPCRKSSFVDAGKPETNTQKRGEFMGCWQQEERLKARTELRKCNLLPPASLFHPLNDRIYFSNLLNPKQFFYFFPLNFWKWLTIHRKYGFYQVRTELSHPRSWRNLNKLKKNMPVQILMLFQMRPTAYHMHPLISCSAVCHSTWDELKECNEMEEFPSKMST